MINLSTLDFLYLSLALGFLILVGFAAYSLYQLSKTLKVLRDVLLDIEDTTYDIRSAKNQFKSTIIGIISYILGRR